MKISVLGAAGNIGAAITFCLMQRGLADEIAMIDTPGDLFEQQFLDMQTAASLRGINITQINDDPAALRGSNIVIVAAAKRQPKAEAAVRANMLNANRELFHGFAEASREHCPLATIIQVSNPIEPLAYILHEQADLKPGQVLGYSLNDTIRFKMMLRRHLELSPKDTVNAVVMGECGNAKVPVFEHVYVNGSLTDIPSYIRENIIAEDQLIFPQLEYLQQATGRTSAWSTALGVSDMVAALNAPKPVPFVCSVYLTGAYGYHDVFCGVPVKLGLGLWQQTLELELAPDTRAALDYSVETIRRASLSV